MIFAAFGWGKRMLVRIEWEGRDERIVLAMECLKVVMVEEVVRAW